MREIKFRGHNGIEWLYDSQISIMPYGKNVHCFMPNEKNKSDQNDVCNWDSVSYVGQYTEIKDINGTEIYEGDIVETTRGLNHIIGAVIYHKASWYIQSKEGYNVRLISIFSTAENKIIGNVYENKELLEENYE
jgi:uncharacterized phage protein (TIGR01671 family)